VGKWLRDGRASGALELLRDGSRRSRRILPQPALDRFLSEHAAGRVDRSWQLWRALGLELWMDAFDVN
jgi:hypothetical protein